MNPIYVIPATADTIDEVIPVGDEAGVAEYFLAEDPAATFWQKLALAIASDYILNLVCGRDLRKAYLLRIFRQLEDGMYSGFCWGHEGKVRSYFAPPRYGFDPSRYGKGLE